MTLLSAIHLEFQRPTEQLDESSRKLFSDLMRALETGEVRAAEPTADGWRVNSAVKEGILLGFRLGKIQEMDLGLPFADKDTYPVQKPAFQARGIRIVPGGSSVRRGAYLGERVTIMPPAYVNVGAYVGAGSMVDSHALVGSCAQIGERVHLSAAAQIGGVLEPVGALPVIIEDDVLVGGNCGVYEGTIVRTGAVLGAGTILTASTPVYDLVHERIIRSEPGQPLVIPPHAVVVPGSRPLSGDFAKVHGLHVQAPMIVKYRDAKTDARLALESALRA